MLINRLYLRNFRVYEDELDLEIPPGLVGIYGPNGAGKSDAARGHPVHPVGQVPHDQGSGPFGRGRR